jgi:hypothetical protein
VRRSGACPRMSRGEAGLLPMYQCLLRRLSGCGRATGVVPCWLKVGCSQFAAYPNPVKPRRSFQPRRTSTKNFEHKDHHWLSSPCTLHRCVLESRAATASSPMQELLDSIISSYCQDCIQFIPSKHLDSALHWTLGRVLSQTDRWSAPSSCGMGTTTMGCSASGLQ